MRCWGQEGSGCGPRAWRCNMILTDHIMGCVEWAKRSGQANAFLLTGAFTKPAGRPWPGRPGPVGQRLRRQSALCWHQSTRALHISFMALLAAGSCCTASFSIQQQSVRGCAFSSTSELSGGGQGGSVVCRMYTGVDMYLEKNAAAPAGAERGAPEIMRAAVPPLLAGWL